MNIDKFAESAKTWDINPHRMEMITKFVGELVKNVNLQSNWKVFEVGAGTGLAGLSILDDVKSVVFEDTSEAMLDVLKRKLTDEEKQKTEVFLGEVSSYKKNDIDLLISNMAFHHIEDTASTAKDIFNLVKSKGIVVISDICTEDGSFHQFQPIPHKGFDMKDFAGKFEKAGFIVDNIGVYNTLKRERIPGKVSEYDQFLLIAHKA